MFPTALIPALKRTNNAEDSIDSSMIANSCTNGLPPESNQSYYHPSSGSAAVYPAPVVLMPVLKTGSLDSTSSDPIGTRTSTQNNGSANTFGTSSLGRREDQQSAGVRFCSPPGCLNNEDDVGAPGGFHVRSHSSQSCHSAASSSPSSLGLDICRICHCESTVETPLISPCYCSGSLKFVHQKCLQQWIKSSQTRSCEVCRYSFHMQTKLKPFTKWEKLDISSVERRKILCSVTFHVIAITCVVWSLYVLIDRTAEEVQAGNLNWPFWTKLVVVAIGFTGGLVFMYVQCKMYVTLFRRWRSYNKVIYVQNCPEANDRASKLSKKKGIHSSPHVVIEMNKTQRSVTVTGTS